MTTDHAAIRARRDAITHTPWKRETNLHGDQWVVPAEGMLVSNVVIAGPNYQPQNAEFIAHAPEDMRALLDENEALLAVIDAAPHAYGIRGYWCTADLEDAGCTCWKPEVGL